MGMGLRISKIRSLVLSTQVHNSPSTWLLQSLCSSLGFLLCTPEVHVELNDRGGSKTTTMQWGFYVKYIIISLLENLNLSLHYALTQLDIEQIYEMKITISATTLETCFHKTSALNSSLRLYASTCH